MTNAAHGDISGTIWVSGHGHMLMNLRFPGSLIRNACRLCAAASNTRAFYNITLVPTFQKSKSTRSSPPVSPSQAFSGFEPALSGLG